MGFASDLLKLANSLSGAPLAAVFIFILGVIVITARRGDWVWKREMVAKDELLAEVKKDRDEWKALALDVRGITRDAVQLAKRRESQRG